MPKLEIEARKWRGGAVVIVAREADQLVMPAAFVFATADGLAWVEPAYADPYGAASPAFHRRAGRMPQWNTVELDSERVTVEPYDPRAHREQVGSAIEWFNGWLADGGRSWAAERRRVRRLVAGGLT